MSAANQRSALAALDQARPAIDRLDLARDADDNAADLLESWGAVETALRALVGGTGLGGQALIRELRTREVISLDAAHSLLEFLAARDRANSATYRPTAGDIAAAREGFQKLESGLLGASVGAPFPTAAAAVAAPAAEAAPADAVAPRRSIQSRVGRVPAWAVLVVTLIVLGGLGFLAWDRFAGGGNPAAYNRGVEAYTAGRREAARAELEKAVRDDPNHAMSHVYLGRIARESGDMATASRELQNAVRLAPRSAIAQREMASFLLSTGNAELARRFYVRALEIDPTDRSAMGFLGCSLVRIGRADMAQRWFQRAGQGPWSACAAARPTMPGQVLPPQPGMLQPGAGYPPGTQPAYPQQVPPGGAYPQPAQPTPYPPQQPRPPA